MKIPSAYADAIWKAYGVPIPEREYRFAAPRKWRFDYAWPDYRIALEIEGGIWSRGRHVRGSGYLADMEKYNEASRQRWRVFRFTPQQLSTGSAQAYMKLVFDEKKGE